MSHDQVRKCFKKFGPNLALDNINLDIKQGEFVFLVGPSGAGKSTLLRILTHEVIPSTGKVLINNVDITKLRDSEIPKHRKKNWLYLSRF